MPAGETVPDVSVVVATRDRCERLRKLLAALRGQTLPSGRFEVVVVDDGSADGTQDLLAEEARAGGLRLTSVRLARSLGPAAARNRGWRLAGAALVAFTDDDCVPTAGWLEALLAAARGGDGLVVRGRTLPDPEEAAALGPFAKTVEIAGPSPHYETCNVAYPRGLLERIGGFDESYPSPAGEDSDLGARAIAAGGAPSFAPDALVHHAVIERRPAGVLRDALLAADGVRAYKLNPELRDALPLGVFYDRSHPMLALPLLALLAGRTRSAALLGLPYAHNLLARTRARGASPLAAPWLVAHDAVQLAATAYGAARNRTLVI
jgi:glycosyltransferase involved in cell wall biosynthesis